MIENIKHKGLKRLYEKGEIKAFPSDYLRKIRTILARLDSAVVIEDMDIHTFKLHQLKGDYQGFWSVTVQANWRIIFRFDNGIAHDVDYLDYH